MKCKNCRFAPPSDAEGFQDECGYFEEYGTTWKDGEDGCTLHWKQLQKNEDEYAEMLGKMGEDMAKDMEINFLREWKEDLMTSLCKYDANSVEEVYQYGINRGRKEMFNEIKMLFKIAISEKPSRTINEAEAEIILRNVEKQIKEQTNDHNGTD